MSEQQNIKHLLQRSKPDSRDFVYRPFNLSYAREINLRGLSGLVEDQGTLKSCVGYSIPDFHFIVKNSYGNKWGDSGYCTMPFVYYNKYVYESWCFDIQVNQPVPRLLWS